MGVFDQAARFATRAEPTSVVARLSASHPLVFRGWLDTRSIPFAGGPDRTADLVAALDDSADSPVLLILEFQSQHDPNKLDVTLEEAAILRSRARHGEGRKDKYRVLTALVYLQGRCPESVLDMTLPGGFGTRHAPLIWNLADDNASEVLEAVATGSTSWGALFWVALMAGGKDEATITRWKEVVTAIVPNRRVRGDLGGIALIFAELVGRGVEWKRQLEGFEMTESQVVNEWISQGEARGELKASRRTLLELLEERFPKSIPNDVTQLIRQQESLDVLHDWFKAAVRAYSFEQFLAVLKK